jgi:hypothetical protein
VVFAGCAVPPLLHRMSDRLLGSLKVCCVGEAVALR